jgi:hypothetical protein
MELLSGKRIETASVEDLAGIDISRADTRDEFSS